MRIVVSGIALTILCMVAIAHAEGPETAPDTSAADPRLNGTRTTEMTVKGPAETEVMSAETAGSSTTAAPVALEQPIDPGQYICGSGDTFELNFWGQQNFRLRLAADLEGRVFISKVGFVNVAGKSLTDVRADVNKKVRADYPGVRFDLTLVAPRAFMVHVADNVSHPGAYAASPLDRVSTLMTRAGGATGSRRRVTIKRKSGSIVTADLVLYELTGDTTYNPYVLDGDVITVPFPEVTASIEGAVRRPGKYELIKTKDLTELLELAGGLTSSAVRSLPIRIVRRNQKEQEVFIDAPFAGGAAPNIELIDDDHVLVRDTNELQRSVQLIGAVTTADTLDTATTSKRLPFIEGDTVLSLIDRAGGVKASGDLRRSYISRPRPKGSPELIPVDLQALLVRRDLQADKPVQMGDLIVVPPMQYSIRVEGAVSRSGLYPYNPTFGIEEYVALAGGRTRSARDLDESSVIESTGQRRSYSVALKPSPGDSILVPERNFTRPEVVQIVLAATGILLSGAAIAFAATR